MAVFALIMSGYSAHAQQSIDRITVDLQNVPLSEAMSEIEEICGYTFFYDEEHVDLAERVSVKADRQSLEDALKTMLAPTGLSFEIRQKQIALFPASMERTAERLVTGTVCDINEEPLVGVAVMLEGTTTGVATDSDGRFALTVPAGVSMLTFSSLGYVTKKVSVPEARQDIKVYMNEDATMLDATVVVGYGDGMFTPPEAMELVRKPSLVIVENEANDWAVVRKWIDLLKKDRQYGNINTIVCQRKDSGYLRPYNAGSSGQIVNSIIQRQKEYHKGTGYKVTVLLDSDKTGPEDALSNEKEKIRQAMVDAGIEGHILYKREMENYFSESVYREAKMIQTDSVPPYSDEDWDFLDIEKAPFTKYQKKDLPTLVEYLDKSSLLKRVGTGRRDYLGEMMNEIQIIIMKLARLS